MSNALLLSPATTETIAAPESRAETESRAAAVAARWISDICSPAVLSLPCLLLAMWMCATPEAIWYAALYFAVAVPAPLVYVVWLVKTGRVRDFHLPDRRDRVGPFLVSLASGVAGLALLVWWQAPASFVAPIFAAFVQTLLLFAITLVWQISIHTATTAGLVTFAILALGGGASILTLLVPIVAWARLHLRRHTLAQTVAGGMLGTAAFATLFALRGIAW